MFDLLCWPTAHHHKPHHVTQLHSFISRLLPVEQSWKHRLWNRQLSHSLSYHCISVVEKAPSVMYRDTKAVFLCLKCWLLKLKKKSWTWMVDLYQMLQYLKKQSHSHSVQQLVQVCVWPTVQTAVILILSFYTLCLRRLWTVRKLSSVTSNFQFGWSSST